MKKNENVVPMIDFSNQETIVKILANQIAFNAANSFVLEWLDLCGQDYATIKKTFPTWRDALDVFLDSQEQSLYQNPTSRQAIADIVLLIFNYKCDMRI